MKPKVSVSAEELRSAIQNLKEVPDSTIRARIKTLEHNLATLKGNTVKIIKLSEAIRVARTIVILGMVLETRSRGTTKV